MLSSTALCRVVAGVLLLISTTPNAVAKPLKVSSDVPFVASLVQAVVGKQDRVTSLMSGTESPHSFALRPRDMRQLQTADLVVMIGEALSPNITRTIKDVAIESPTLAMLELPELQEFIYRNDDNTNDEAFDRVHGLDPHIWLDPIIVSIMATAIGEQLATLDAARADEFRSNAKKVAAELMDFHSEQLARWSNQQTGAFVTLHEVSRYFQRRYSLNSIGSLFEGEHVTPSAKHLKQLQERMRSNKVECVITDPTTSTRWVDTLTQGQSVAVVSINALGSIDNDTNYLNVLQKVSDTFAQCLGVP